MCLEGRQRVQRVGRDACSCKPRVRVPSSRPCSLGLAQAWLPCCCQPACRLLPALDPPSACVRTCVRACMHACVPRRPGRTEVPRTQARSCAVLALLPHAAFCRRAAAQPCGSSILTCCEPKPTSPPSPPSPAQPWPARPRHPPVRPASLHRSAVRLHHSTTDPSPIPPASVFSNSLYRPIVPSSLRPSSLRPLSPSPPST